MLSDIEIAQQAKMQKITDVAAKLGISEDDIELYGKYKAKLSYDLIRRVKDKKDGKLILVYTCLVGLLEPVCLILQSVRESHSAEFIHQFAVFLHIEDLVCPGDIRKAYRCVQADLRTLAPLSLLCGDEDDSVGCA